MVGVDGLSRERKRLSARKGAVERRDSHKQHGPNQSEPLRSDAQGNSYILGWSASTDYPVSANAYQPERALSNAGILINNMVLTKVSPSDLTPKVTRTS